jgi:prepilin-type N-terminal cleavage/methylation domain-containing protein
MAGSLKVPDVTTTAFTAPMIRPSSGPRTSARRCPLRRIGELAGFTLAELLVVVAILAVIIALLVPAIAKARQSADRAREIAAARMLVGAWQQYAQDSAGTILPGYKSGLPAFDANRNPIATQTIGVAANRWVWRLAPYIGHDMRGLFVGDHERLLKELEESDPSNYLYQTSVFPSFGLNSAWIGGDENYGGFNSAFLSTFGKFYATRLSEIGRPADMLVFASARGIEASPMGGGPEGLTEGFFRVRSPFFDSRVWAAGYSETDAASCGNLSARHAGEAVVGCADGHAETASPMALDDMRRWAPGADARDWRLTPGGG